MHVQRVWGPYSFSLSLIDTVPYAYLRADTFELRVDHEAGVGIYLARYLARYGGGEDAT